MTFVQKTTTPELYSSLQILGFITILNPELRLIFVLQIVEH
jgi:hypothetical protein